MKRVFCALLLFSCQTATAEMLLQRVAKGQATEFSYQNAPEPKLVFQLDNKLLDQYRGMKNYMPHMTTKQYAML